MIDKTNSVIQCAYHLRSSEDRNGYNVSISVSKLVISRTVTLSELFNKPFLTWIIDQ